MTIFDDIGEYIAAMFACQALTAWLRHRATQKAADRKAGTTNHPVPKGGSSRD